MRTCNGKCGGENFKEEENYDSSVSIGVSKNKSNKIKDMKFFERFSVYALFHLYYHTLEKIIGEILNWWFLSK